MKKILKFLIFTVLFILVVFSAWLWVLYISADMGQPTVKVNLSDYKVADSGYKACRGSYLQYNKNGLWEAYLSGNPIERGVAFGRLSESLLYFQEKVFVDQIRELVPSESYLKFLSFFIRIFNRNLGQYVPMEFREEIYGMSLSCTPKFNFIGPPYERQINYHAAHDIGHLMHDYMLVGCSSLGVWGKKSKDSSLIIGRNFDFYLGENFAKNKLVVFVNPTTGYKFASVGWAGMFGVLSGMNETGLTVTINAAKGSIPKSAAMPITILAREILQYASTIDEAYAIARKRKTFVSESLLIGSAKDGCAAIIEKLPDSADLYRSKSNQIICTNHYQGAAFSEDEANIENIGTSDSPFRFKRIKTLLDNQENLDVLDIVKILRDRKGENGEDIGLANEKSINQSICHHSVIFKPQQLLMWVSTAPWQSGKMICYNLKEVFNKQGFSNTTVDDKLTIEEDSFFIRKIYPDILESRSLTKYIILSTKAGFTVAEDSILKLIRINPNFFHTYDVIGDYYQMKNEKRRATEFWIKALSKEVPRQSEKDNINKKIKRTIY
jgi:hypothetical protein